MVRFTLSAWLACCVAIATGERPAFQQDSCSQGCSDDDSNGRCPPDCADCICCPHLQPVAITTDVRPDPVTLPTRIPQRPIAIPASPAADEILHVPIAVFA